MPLFAKLTFNKNNDLKIVEIIINKNNKKQKQEHTFGPRSPVTQLSKNFRIPSRSQKTSLELYQTFGKLSKFPKNVHSSKAPCLCWSLTPTDKNYPLGGFPNLTRVRRKNSDSLQLSPASSGLIMPTVSKLGKSPKKKLQIRPL